MTSDTQSSEISSLIRLLDDPDPFVLDHVGNRLVELGTEAVPFLEMACRGENIVLKTRAMKVLEQIAPQQLEEAFHALGRTAPGDDIDLEKGVLLLMRFGHPQADPGEVRRQLDSMAEDLSFVIQPGMPPAEALDRLIDYLFYQKEFHGNQTNYIDPDNSYLNTVLKNRTGLPIALSAICILIGQRLNLPIVGIGLPYHFIAKFNSTTDPVLFDPFHQGRILTMEKCKEMVQSFGVKFEEHYLFPVSNREILIRMIQNLVIAYQKEGDEEKMRTLEQFSNVLLGSR